jgi:hypothetical protein
MDGLAGYVAHIVEARNNAIFWLEILKGRPLRRPRGRWRRILE